MVEEGDGWGAAHWERPLEIDGCCVLVRGREGVGWSNGKTVMRVVQGKKDPSTGRTSSACGVVWLSFVFRSFGNGLWGSSTVATLYLYIAFPYCARAFRSPGGRSP